MRMVCYIPAREMLTLELLHQFLFRVWIQNMPANHLEDHHQLYHSVLPG